ncbi:MAG: TonB-dependent receptor [Acidobacteria bacterium]|nr:TonB-dependent receptor [Acidobacteriota bacterium]
MRTKWWGMIALLTLVAAIPVAFGQTNQTGVIAGAVVDSEQKPVADATVSVAQADGSYPQTAISGADGGFRIGFLPPGVYEIAVSAPSFSPRTLPNVRVNAGRVTEADVVLFREVREEVTVSAAAPLIDTTTMETTTILDDTQISRLPIARTATGLVNFTPGATNGSVWGAATDQANTYRLDGVSVDQPGFGGSFLIPNVDWIEEFQVRGLGAGAEYGNFQGGQINIVTRSGSNTFKANLRTNIESESLNASNINLAEDGRETDTRFEVNADVSGPILEDKLYYFFSVQQVSLDTRVVDRAVEDRIAFLGTQEERVENKLYGKLTWQATSADRFNVILGYDDVETDNREIGSFVDVEATQKQESPSWFYNLSWNRSFGQNLLLEAKVTGYSGEDDRLPRNGELPAVQELFGDRRLFRNATYLREREPESLAFAANLDWFVETGSIEHQFKFGAETTYGAWRESRRRNGNLSWRPDIINDPDFGDPPFDPADVTTWVGLISSDWGGDIDLDAETENTALYVQDYIKLNSYVTIGAGLRYGMWKGELNPGFGSGPRFTALDTNGLDPRLGVTWDVGGDGRWVAKAHWGRYHQSIFALMFDRAQGGNVFTDFEYWDWVGAGLPDIDRPYTPEERDNDPDNWELFEVDPFGQEVGAVENLDQPYIDQIVLSLEHALTDNWKVGVTYVNRESENIIALVDRNLATNYTFFPGVSVFRSGDPVLDANGQPLVLPGIWVANDDILFVGSAPGLTPDQVDALTWDPDFVLTNPDGAEQTFDQLQLTTEYRTSGFSVSGSLVWTKLEGTFNSVSGYSDPNGQEGAGGFVRPNEQINWDGDLEDGQEWEAKVFATADLPLGFRLGGFLTYESGSYYTPLYVLDRRNDDYVAANGESFDPDHIFYISGDRIYTEERGSREFDSRMILDLRVEKLFKIKDLDFVLSLDAFNVLGEDAPVQLVTQVGSTVDSFGTVTRREAPRALRLGASLHW